MRPIDQFLRSVQDSFAANRQTNGTHLVLAVSLLTAIALYWVTSLWLRRRNARRDLARRIQTVLGQARLSADDLEDLNRIAVAGGAALLDVMTVVASFEHATARLLERDAPVLRPGPASWYARVRRFRVALGFSPLSAHLWLLSTRELVVGDSVNAGENHGRVVEVNEACFAAEWPITATVAGEATTTLTVDRPDDARYLVRVRLMHLETLPALSTPLGERPASQRAFFTHDEQPERQQDRAHLRLRISVPVRVQIADRVGRSGGDPKPAPRGPAPASTLAGTVVDVSAGGLALHLPTPPEGPLARGARVFCWFALDGEAVFDAVAALVVGFGPAAAGHPGELHLRLSFTGLDAIARDRLVAAVARRQVAAASAPAHELAH